MSNYEFDHRSSPEQEPIPLASEVAEDVVIIAAGLSEMRLGLDMPRVRELTTCPESDGRHAKRLIIPSKETLGDCSMAYHGGNSQSAFPSNRVNGLFEFAYIWRYTVPEGADPYSEPHATSKHGGHTDYVIPLFDSSKGVAYDMRLERPRSWIGEEEWRSRESERTREITDFINDVKNQVNQAKPTHIFDQLRANWPNN